MPGGGPTGARTWTWAKVPVLTCWPEDGGPFITLPVVFTHHPETGRRNVGMYRLQVYDAQTTGMHWHAHKGGAQHYRVAEARGEALPVAVAIGPDPAVTYAATAPLPEDIDEILFAGFLRGEPVEMVPCVTQPLSGAGGIPDRPGRLCGAGGAAGGRPLRRPHRLLLPGG